MISEKDKIRLEDAKTCTSCIEWHKHCMAECCKIIEINVPFNRLTIEKKNVIIHKHLTLEERQYYKLRGVRYMHGKVLFPAHKCKPYGLKTIYFSVCDKLKDNKCIGYPDNRPNICKEFTAETALTSGKAIITPNCMYKYQVKE